MAKKRTGLGRGLGALLDEQGSSKPEKISGVGAAPKGGISEIPVAAIEVNPFQPRTDFNQEALVELSESIKVQGITQLSHCNWLNDTLNFDGFT